MVFTPELNTDDPAEWPQRHNLAMRDARRWSPVTKANADSPVTAFGDDDAANGVYVDCIFADATAGDVTINLPLTSTLYDGRPLRVFRTDGSGNTVFVTQALDKINGLSTQSIITQYGGLDIITDVTGGTYHALAF